jgi:hypothetical protein
MTTAARFKVFPNLYKDSVTLMQLGAGLRSRVGVAEASCIMATPANLAQLADAGLAIDVAVAPSDLLVVVRGEPSACEDAIAAAGECSGRRAPPAEAMPLPSACRFPASRSASSAPARPTSRSFRAGRLCRGRGAEGAGARSQRDALFR